MSQALRVSIVIPAYNEADRLTACLEAVAAQTVKPYEVIVVDNNSSDDTAAIARRYSFVTLVHETKQGIVYARNAGFDAASGDIIGRTDADVLLDPDWVEVVSRFYAQANHRTAAWTSGGRFYNMHFSPFVSGTYNLLAFRFNQLLMGGALWGSSMAVPRPLWQTVRAEVENRTDIHEDLDLAIHLHRHSYQVTYDRHTHVRAELKRIYSGRHELWNYVQLWPRTLRIHGIWTWPICWLVGEVLLYVGTLFLAGLERFANLFDRPTAKV